MLMLAYEPMLIFDVGFQLSVGATTGLLLLGPWLGRLFDRVWLVGGDIRDSLAAQIAVWPILLITFGNLSVFAVLVNGLILWLVPVIMGLGAVLGVAGVVWRPLGQVMGWVVYGPLTLMVRMIEWFGAKEWMSLVVEGVSWWWGWGYYLVLGWLLVKFYKYNKKNVK